MHLLIVVVIESVEKGGWARGSILLSTARSIARARRSQHEQSWARICLAPTRILIARKEDDDGSVAAWGDFVQIR